MDGKTLSDARMASAWTQQDAAQRLGVTQAYLSMVERGVRRVSKQLAGRAIEVYAVPVTAFPLEEFGQSRHDSRFFKQALGGLGYSGFGYLEETVSGESGRRRPAMSNPASLLMHALDSEDLDARVAEALPWLPLAYPKLAWEWLMCSAKLRDRQNRLGFVIRLAERLAEKKQEHSCAALLREQADVLERSRLAAEDTLCKESMTQAERRWLRTHRTRVAEHWNLLTDLDAEQLDHVYV